MAKRISGLVALLLLIAVGAGAAGWGWKKATTPDDVMNFLNGTPPYKPLKAAEVASANSAAGTTEFFIFYKLK